MPYADPKLCASFTESVPTYKAHFNRAVLEGVAFSLLDCKNALDEIDIPHEDEAIIIGGGAKSPLWRQIVADVLDISVKQPKNSDSSFGAAMLAGVATGVFDSFGDALNKSNENISITSPNKENTQKYMEIFKDIKRYTMR